MRAIHRRNLRNVAMDGRVKPGHDKEVTALSL